jgi:hypothetical protein
MNASSLRLIGVRQRIRHADVDVGAQRVELPLVGAVAEASSLATRARIGTLSSCCDSARCRLVVERGGRVHRFGDTAGRHRERRRRPIFLGQELHEQRPDDDRRDDRREEPPLAALEYLEIVQRMTCVFHQRILIGLAVTICIPTRVRSIRPPGAQGSDA